MLDKQLTFECIHCDTHKRLEFVCENFNLQGEEGPQYQNCHNPSAAAKRPVIGMQWHSVT
jgi:hypothetical protein